ncbi:hypothetical protein BCO_0900009 [Borrelia coriaceae ATCC 43381]|uniref:Uncharacterized protein n=1 Tax=Borrelia coriaceae ATCC 43381 TaxID=1408429 RepID=W5SUL7_9SPIR|nr:hypothetical protein BCO_0900009 [Borrelia coriaceae ATCC 43381]
MHLNATLLMCYDDLCVKSFFYKIFGFGIKIA